jgi:hypothetical protein
MLQHNGRDIFLTGVNLGNVQLLPFEGNPYGLPAAELRSLVGSTLADIAATGANSVRIWLHIDGSRSPSWGIDQARKLIHLLPVALYARSRAFGPAFVCPWCMGR